MCDAVIVPRGTILYSSRAASAISAPDVARAEVLHHQPRKRGGHHGDGGEDHQLLNPVDLKGEVNRVPPDLLDHVPEGLRPRHDDYGVGEDPT